MSKTAPPNFSVIEAKFESRRQGPRLDTFDSALSSMGVGTAFDIPTHKNAKGKVVPQFGFNLKAANMLYAPKVFKKRRVRNDAGEDVLRVFRVK